MFLNIKKLENCQKIRSVNLMIEKENNDLETVNKLAESYFLKGQSLIEMKDYNEALCCFQRVVELQPDNAEVGKF
jgi:tetratricopeptide (TPR) repeat protein